MENNIENNVVSPAEKASKATAKESNAYILNLNAKDFRGAYRDPSVWLLVISNIYAAYEIIVHNIPIGSVLMIFWLQSIIIGSFTLITIICARLPDSQILNLSDAEKTNIPSQKLKLALYFTLIYGFFHFIYLAFIIGSNYEAGKTTTLLWGRIFSIAFVFFLNHLFSFIYYFKKEINSDLVEVVNNPFRRIIPMHIMMILSGGMGQWAVIPFLLLKTFIDVYGHIAKHVRK